MLKTVLLNIFVETTMVFLSILCLRESSKVQHLFELKIFCNIINVFTVTFDQLNASLLNKNLTDPNICSGIVYVIV